MAEKVDIAIIGAGVVGLAIAYELSRSYPNKSIVLIEKNARVGQETSSRNSEVIHAGLYYPEDSMKSKFCRQGNELLYEFCAQHGVNHSRIGKIIVATCVEELPSLERILKIGQVCDRKLELLEGDQVRELEPDIHAVGGVFSPDTGIIDSEGLAQRLLYLSKNNGVMVLLNRQVMGLKQSGGSYVIQLTDENIEAEKMINSAGLNCYKVAAMVGLDIDKYDYRLKYCKGEYYQLNKKFKVNHLIYPVPDHVALGIHITLDLQGRQKLGPNAYYVDSVDYSMDERFHDVFFAAARQYLPELRMDDIQPDYAGVRPKLQGPHESFRDFVIREESDKGYPGLVNLIGIESPGLTSCLAIARYVASLVA
ncbi:MAG: NAD(P)/FAD-dependent oxidoreductase [Candidatus Saccharibacteria bacterium]